MDIVELLSTLIVVSAVFSYLNTRLFKLPDSIGVMVLSLIFSLVLIGLNVIRPTYFSLVRQTIAQLDFSRLVFDGMLSFLLFAGAFHTDATLLRIERRSVMLFAFIGVLLSTAFVGTGLFCICQWSAIPQMTFPICLLFGSLISPTDPIAVLGILTKFQLPDNLKITLVGESLFNDGIGVVVFSSIYYWVLNGTDSIGVGEISWLFVREAGGGVLFGLALGYGIFGLFRTINHYQTEVLITVAGVLGGYWLAQQLHISAPLAMVFTGLLVGDRVRQDAMSRLTREYVDKFWELIDSLLNSVLFVLIGVELLIIDFHVTQWTIYFLVVLIVLLSRYMAVFLPFQLTRRWLGLDNHTPLMLTWGGLRGALSIAMALSVSNTVPQKEFLVTITYAVVLFSVLGQGLTMERLIRRLYPTG